MSFLLDTNIVSELRHGARANPGLVKWFDDQEAKSLYLSVVTIGEIRQGIEQLRPRDRRQASALDRWLNGLVQFHEDRLLYVDGAVAEEWGRLRAAAASPVIDTFLAATARVHKLTMVTRNVRDFAKLRVRLLNPFATTP